jgi:transposase
MSEKPTRRSYSEEFKAQAVHLLQSQGDSVAETARRLGINRSLLDRWRRERTAPGLRSGKNPVTDERDFELRRLRAENRRLREERAVLKKATAFFVKESH